jgi:hypothetical protein
LRFAVHTTWFLAFAIALDPEIAHLAPIPPTVSNQPVIFDITSHCYGAIANKLDSVIHHEVVATTQHTSTIELETRTTCSNADGYRSNVGNSIDQCSVIIGREHRISRIESHRLNLAGFATSSGTRV